MVFKKVDGFEVDIEQEIGHGQYSFVFIGRHSSTKELVAAKRIKVDEDDKEHVEDVMKEVQALQKIPPHINIVNFLSTERTATLLWIFTEYCREGDLHSYNKRHGLDEDQKMSIMIDCATALVHLHGLETPVAHRDVKPDNVLLVVSQGKLTAKLCDFGVAKV